LTSQLFLLASLPSTQDAYVLSESSLFVWPFKMMLKTCGTTTLLRCLPRLLKYTALLGLELEWVGYSRKNYSFPGTILGCFPF
jgi:S-adenosylmethionine decarboxylase